MAFDGPAVRRLYKLSQNLNFPDADNMQGRKFEVAAMRVEHLIWDKILSSEAALTKSGLPEGGGGDL